MPKSITRYVEHFLGLAKTAFVGPQILAFVPALLLVAFWFGEEAAMMFVAVALPALLCIVGLFTPLQTAGVDRGPLDPITRLPLRSALEAALDRGFAIEPDSGLRSAALALEIDDFEQYRNQYGDKAADQILRTTAERIEGVMRELDIVGRLERSLFVVALAPARRADLETMIQISARLQGVISEPYMIDSLRLFLTASVGFCVPRRAGEKNGAFCIEAAEVALNEAQANGVGAIRAYSAQPKRKRVMRTGLVGEVGAALENGQIVPWFQPQLLTDTGRVSGVEALARWHHPDRGVILPGAFLPAISAAGMSDRLCEVTLFHSMTAIRDWDAAGIVVPSVGVNFSGDDLSDPKLCDKIKWELDRFNLTPDRITVEILETVIARGSSDIITHNIADLANLGCKIDLDDFGTGHASISNIRRFNVQRIKIDRSFISSVDSDRQQQQMLTAILEMANRLEIDTLAEGVETADEHAILAQLGCAHVQGYHIAKPLPFADAAEWLAQHQTGLPNEPEITPRSGT